MEIIGIMGIIFILAACCFTVYYDNVNSGNTFILYLVLLCLGAGAIMLSFIDKLEYEAVKVPVRITGFVLITIAMLFIFRYFYKKK